MRVRRTNAMLESGFAHPTRIQIVEAAAEIVKTRGLAGLHIDLVLEATGLSRGAVYHHFENVDHLRESAILQIYTEGIDANIVQVRQVMGSVTSKKKFREGIFRANRVYAENKNLAAVRIVRAYAMSITSTSDEFAENLAREQQRLTDAYIEVIIEAQERGLVREDLDPAALAVFLQAYSFGFIVDEVGQSHLDVDSWATMIEQFYDRCVFA